jgi:hypothetical protein
LKTTNWDNLFRVLQANYSEVASNMTMKDIIDYCLSAAVKAKGDEIKFQLNKHVRYVVYKATVYPWLPVDERKQLFTALYTEFTSVGADRWPDYFTSQVRCVPRAYYKRFFRFLSPRNTLEPGTLRTPVKKLLTEWSRQYDASAVTICLVEPALRIKLPKEFPQSTINAVQFRVNLYVHLVSTYVPVYTRYAHCGYLARSNHSWLNVHLPYVVYVQWRWKHDNALDQLNYTERVESSPGVKGPFSKHYMLGIDRRASGVADYEYVRSVLLDYT